MKMLNICDLLNKIYIIILYINMSIELKEQYDALKIIIDAKNNSLFESYAIELVFKVIFIAVLEI